MATAQSSVLTEKVKTKNIFLPIDKSQTVSMERRLLCPECGELLQRADIETFFKCPFCNHEFEMDAELEDFIISPIVQEWTRHQSDLPVPAEDVLLP